MFNIQWSMNKGYSFYRHILRGASLGHFRSTQFFPNKIWDYKNALYLCTIIKRCALVSSSCSIFSIGGSANQGGGNQYAGTASFLFYVSAVNSNR